MIVILQGTEFKYKVKSQIAIMTIFDGLNRYSLKYVEMTDGEYYIVSDAETTKNFVPGRYKFQVIDNLGNYETGVLKIKANLEFADSPFSYWEKVLHAIDDRLAGKAEDPTNSVSVGDKNLSYYSLSDLIKLREFALGRIAEEKAEEGESTSAANSQKTIYFQWR